MDNLDTTVDIAHDDVRAGQPAGDPGPHGERAGLQRSDAGAASSRLTPGALLGNPLRVRL